HLQPVGARIGLVFLPCRNGRVAHSQPPRQFRRGHSCGLARRGQTVAEGGGGVGIPAVAGGAGRNVGIGHRGSSLPGGGPGTAPPNALERLRGQSYDKTLRNSNRSPPWPFFRTRLRG